MEVIENQTNSIVANRLDLGDAYMSPAGYEFAFARAMALNLGGRAVHPQELCWQRELPAVVEGYVQRPACACIADFSWKRRRQGVQSFVSSRASSINMIGMPSRTG